MEEKWTLEYGVHKWIGSKINHQILQDLQSICTHLELTCIFANHIPGYWANAMITNQTSRTIFEASLTLNFRGCSSNLTENTLHQMDIKWNSISLVLNK